MLKDKRVPLKSAPRLAFKTQVNFVSPYDLEKCVSSLRENQNNPKKLLGTTVKEILVDQSIVYFSAEISGPRLSLLFIGEIREHASQQGSHIRGNIGQDVLIPILALLICTIVFIYVAINFSPLPIQIVLLFLIAAIIYVVIYYPYSQSLRAMLKDDLQHILSDLK